MQAVPQVLVVDDDAVSRRVLVQALGRAGLACQSVASGAEALTWLTTGNPALVLLDLLMPEPDGYELLARLRRDPRHADTPIVVLTALDADEDIERVFASGADDYVKKPFREAELVARIRGQLRVREYLDDLTRRSQSSQTVMELTQTLASSLDIREILFTVVKRVAEVAGVDRCSIVLARPPEDVAYVVASSDDEQLKDLPIDLAKYPEIKQVLATGQALVITDAAKHPLLEAVRQPDAPEFRSVALVPIIHDERPLGALFLRSRASIILEDHEIELVTTVAHTTAIALRNARLLQSLRDETLVSTNARVEAERRLLLFQRYADFFESSADGMVVIDRQGRVLLSNPRAREITGYSESALAAQTLSGLLAEDDNRRQAERLLAGFSDSVYPRGIDFSVRTHAGEIKVLNLSFSSVLHEDDAILFTFHDVTRERRTAAELTKTKDFLERVIDSSPDAIVSADLTGRVLLFNRAASRIFGFDAADVVGKVSVEIFYPEHVAREVMRMIRSDDHGGPGRLEDYRVDMLGRHRESIPVKLSAALIYDGGEPVGSVGIFTDIRERLRMEERLQMAQEELRTREKQSIVAELAGTAAHELNQPLTSVIGYAELLRRQLADADPQFLNAAGIIITEAERMAEIVRKIGKITRYETKSYVGEQRILDLDKASEDSAASSRGGA